MSVFRADVERGPLVPCACGCGTTIEQFDAKNRERKYVRGHQFSEWWNRNGALGPTTERSVGTRSPHRDATRPTPQT